MTATVQKWGNSLAIRLPRETVKRFSLERGTSIVFVPKKNELVLKPTMQKTYRLKDLVAGITKKNLPDAVWPNTTPLGNEAW